MSARVFAQAPGQIEAVSCATQARALGSPAT
jgi:hypothetical protein